MYYKHGHAHHEKRMPEYNAWQSMIQRCSNPNHPQYKYWGGRGIYVEDYFLGPNGFQHFFNYMGLRPLEHSLDRWPDNDGNYIRGNVRWATKSQQAENSRTKSCQYWFVGIAPNGECVVSNNQSEFARRYRLYRSNISSCLNGRLKTTGKWRFRHV